MYRILRQSTICIPINYHHVSRPIKPIRRSFSIQHSTQFPLKTISASIALTFSFYLCSQHSVKAEATKSSSPQATLTDLYMEETDPSLQTKTTTELAIALFVYQLCSFPWLVDAAPSIIAASERFHLQTPLYWFLRHTFFHHFCGGQSSDECKSIMERLASSDIRCILDLSIEADLSEKSSENEQGADVILEKILTSIRTAGSGERFNAMVAIKITAFIPPKLLLRLSQCLNRLDQSFLEHQENGVISAQGISRVVQDLLPPAQDREQQNKRQLILDHLSRKKGTLDLLEFRKLFDLQGPGRDIWWKTSRKEESILTCKDLEAYDRMMNRVNQACSLAHQLNVGIMVDAEQSYFQNAIDHVAINFQRKYNHQAGQAPTVFNTYQMYTKSSRERLELDVALSKRENFVFAAKLVRGAYMISERKRARELNYPSLIHDSLKDTHDSYNGGIRFLLNELHQQTLEKPLSVTNSPIVFMVASHNRESVMLTIEEMERNQISPHSGVVLFGQLFSMKDQISYTLARHGYATYKYLPYGLVDEVIPYLLRRAQENSAVLCSVSQERRLIWNELKRRMFGRTSITTEKSVNSA